MSSPTDAPFEGDPTPEVGGPTPDQVPEFQSSDERRQHAEEEPWHELLSAQLDGALDAGEEETLLAHLASDSAAQRQRRRIQRLVRTLRGSGPYLSLSQSERGQVSASLDARLGEEVRLELSEPAALDPALKSALKEAGPLVPVSGEDYATLDRRLEAELAAEREGAQAGPLRVLAGGGASSSDELAIPDDQSEELELRLVDDPTPERTPEFFALPTTESGRLRARRVSPGTVRLAVAAALLLTCGVLVLTGGQRAKEAFQAWRHSNPSPRATPLKVPLATPTPSESRPEIGVAVLPSPTPSPATSPSPAESPAPTARPASSPTPSPSPSPAPRETPAPSVAPSPTPTPRHTGGTQQRPVETPKPPVEVDVAALRRELGRIRDPQCPALERRERLEGLAQERFDHPEAYAFLEGVLREGTLDRLSGPNAARRAAVLALGRFGGQAAAESLLAVPLRQSHLLADAANYRQAVAFLSEPEAVARMATGIAEGGNSELVYERRHAAILGLGDRAHPAATEGLLALYASKKQPEVLRRDAGRVVGRCGDAKAFGPLLAGLRDKRRKAWRLRQGAAWGLGGLAASLPSEADDCVAALSSATDSGHPLADEAAIQALGRTRTRLAVDPLLDLLDDRRAGVRRLAHRSLCYLAGREPKGVRSARQWREFWGKVPNGLPEVAQEELDLASFRDLPSRAGGVVFVVDASGSMATRWDLVRYELKSALERCGPQTRFQLLFFSDYPKAMLSKNRMAPATPQNRAQALEWVERQRAIDVAQTGLSKAMEQALTSYPAADQIYLISDAILSKEDYWDLRTRVERWNRKRARPVAVHAVHIRDGSASVRWEPRPPQLKNVPADVDFMHRLAWENDGVYAHN
jgi:HEAT repeat protein